MMVGLCFVGVSGSVSSSSSTIFRGSVLCSRGCREGQWRKGGIRMADGPLVFVAGAGGRLGGKIVDVLASRNIPVRAGSRDPSRLKETEGVERVEFVVPAPPEEIEPKLKDVEVVVSAMASTSLPLGPYSVDWIGTKNLIEAAAATKSVKHFVLITSIGVKNQLAFPAAVLNLVGGCLFFKGLAEDNLRESGVPYTIIRPGGESLRKKAPRAPSPAPTEPVRHETSPYCN